MRRVFLAITALGGLLAGLVGTATPADALAVVDFGTTIVELPATISPAGESVKYTVTYTNSADSLATWAGTATDSTTGGSLLRVDGDTTGCTVPAVGTANPTITCSVSLAPGTSRSLGVVIASTLTAPSTVTNTSTIVANPDVLGIVPDTNQENNTATESTPVTNDPNVSTGFLRVGDSMSYKRHTLTATAAYGSGNGVIPSMSDSVVLEGDMCGDVQCDDEGLHYDFTQGGDGEAYEGLVEIKVLFTTSSPCYGYGNTGCTAIFWRKGPGDAEQIEPVCDSTPQDDTAPCLVSIQKVGQQFQWTIRANTDDPDIIATVLEAAGGTAKA